MSAKPETPGTTNLTAEQQQWFDRLAKRPGDRYVAVADGSRGGVDPGRKYGRGTLAATVKGKKR